MIFIRFSLTADILEVKMLVNVYKVPGAGGVKAPVSSVCEMIGDLA